MTNFWQMLTVGILWALLTLVWAIRLAPSRMSDFELSRRIQSGDERALREAELRMQLPLLGLIRTCIAGIFGITIVVLLVVVCGPLWAAAIGLGLAAITGLLGRWRGLVRWTTSHFERYRYALYSVASKLEPMLRFALPSRGSLAQSLFSREELQYLLEQNTGALKPDEARRLLKALEFGDMTIGQAMVPLADMDYIEAEESLGPLVIDGLHKLGHRIYPVVGKDPHDIRGLLYMRDLRRLNPAYKKVADAMQPGATYVQSSWPLAALMRASLRTRQHLFIVVNDKKQTVGLITMLDVLQQLLGQDIPDTTVDYENPDSVVDTSL